MRGVRAGLLVCLATGLLAFSAVSSAAGSSLTKHCAGRVSATQPGVKLVASRISISATASKTLRSVPPALRCSRARTVIHDFLLAKLTRPLKQCTTRVLRGGGCKVDGWLCYENAFVSQPPPGSLNELCTHLAYDRHHVLRRLTHVFFRETDHDRG